MASPSPSPKARKPKPTAEEIAEIAAENAAAAKNMDDFNRAAADGAEVPHPNPNPNPNPNLNPRWIARGGGYLVVTASAAGLLTQVGSLPYLYIHQARRLSSPNTQISLRPRIITPNVCTLQPYYTAGGLPPLHGHQP